MGDSARLCTGLTAASPPQCVFDYLDLSNLELDALNSVATEGAVSWTQYEVQLTGTLEDSTFVIE
jgi:hypothetical protein